MAMAGRAKQLTQPKNVSSFWCIYKFEGGEMKMETGSLVMVRHGAWLNK
jgi:hypothetical protein